MRPGRLDRILYVGPPDREGRIEILRIRTNKMSVDLALDLEALADLVSSDIFGLLNYDNNRNTDGWMLRRGAGSSLSRRGVARHARGHQRAVRKYLFIQTIFYVAE